MLLCTEQLVMQVSLHWMASNPPFHPLQFNVRDPWLLPPLQRLANPPQPLKDTLQSLMKKIWRTRLL